MQTDVYITVSNGRGRLVVDGNLKLLSEFLETMRSSLTQEHDNKEPNQNEHLKLAEALHAPSA